MRQASKRIPDSAEKTLRDIRRATRRHHSAEEKIRIVLEGLRGENRRERNALLCTIAIVALGSGLRRGELCALRWSNIDFDNRTLRVEQSLEQTQNGLRFKAPKTKHGLRSMTLPASVISELRAHWRTQNEQRLALGIGRSTPTDLVFPAWDSRPLMPNTLSREWSRTIGAIGGRQISLHALRHTHASSLIAAGVDILTVSRSLVMRIRRLH